MNPLTLHQKKFGKGRQEFSLIEDGHITVVRKGLGLERIFSYTLLEIDPRPGRIFTRNNQYLWFAVIFGLVTAACLFFAFKNSGDDRVASLVCAFIFFGVSLFGAIGYLGSEVNIVAFYGRMNGNLIFAPWYGRPDQTTFDGFIKELSRRIQEANDRAGEIRQQYAETMAGEIISLKKLVNDGLLTEAEFEKAKAKILEVSQGNRPIGF